MPTYRFTHTETVKYEIDFTVEAEDESEARARYDEHLDEVYGDSQVEAANNSDMEVVDEDASDAAERMQSDLEKAPESEY